MARIKQPLIFLITTCLFGWGAAVQAADDDSVPPILMLMQDSQPKYLIQRTGVSGLCGELYLAIQRHLLLEKMESTIVEQYVPIKRILNMVEHKEDYIFCGAGRNKERDKRFIYAKTPVYHVSNVVAAHKSDAYEPRSLQDIADNKGVIGALYGTSSAKYLKDKIGDRWVNDSFTDLQMGLKMVANPPYNVRYFYYHDLGLNYLTKTSDLPLKVVSTRFRTVPQWLIYSKKMDKKKARILEKILQNMKRSGELESIVSRYIF